jgi:hypothetical protein
MTDSVQCVDDFKNSDFGAIRREWYFEFPGLSAAISHILKDQRDMPIIHAFSNILALVTAPGCIVFYCIASDAFGQYTWMLKYIYWLYTIALFAEPFILGLHYSSHRAIFVREWMWLSHLVRHLIKIR